MVVRGLDGEEIGVFTMGLTLEQEVANDICWMMDKLATQSAESGDTSDGIIKAIDTAIQHLQDSRDELVTPHA